MHTAAVCPRAAWAEWTCNARALPFQPSFDGKSKGPGGDSRAFLFGVFAVVDAVLCHRASAPAAINVGA